MIENRKYYFLKLKEDFFEQDTIVLLESLMEKEQESNQNCMQEIVALISEKEHSEADVYGRNQMICCNYRT